MKQTQSLKNRQILTAENPVLAAAGFWMFDRVQVIN